MFQFLTRLSALILATGVLLPAQQTVWFTPLPYTSHPAGFYGSTDYLSLFSPSAPWQQAASRVQVFKIYGLGNLSDSDLTTLMTNLHQRNIALAMEWPVLTSSTCGIGIEGFGGNLLPTVQRIQALGGTLTYLAMQQPFQWGSLYTGTSSCQWTAQQVATNALVQINAAKTVFPNLQVGDISAVPPFQNMPADWVAQYENWFDTWRSFTGSPLAFFHVDVDWTVPNWQAAVAAIRPAVEQRGIPFGMVYNGFLTDETDAGWMAAAEGHFVDFEVTSGYAPPEQVNFQSWNPNPTHVLPETDPTAFTYLIDRYFRARTNLTVTNSGAQLSGTLSSAGSGVTGASVQLTSQALSGSGAIATYTITGTSPLEARSALVGARVDSECYSCDSASDVSVYRFVYNDTVDALTQRDFSQGSNGWLLSGTASAAFDAGPPPFAQGLHITAQPGQNFTLNSTGFTVRPGVPFTLQVSARVSPLSIGSGYFTLIWFDANNNEPSREVIMFEPQTQILTTVTTAADGSFSAGIPVDPGSYQVTAQYAGSSTLWPSTTSVPPNPAPPSPPAIVSLNPPAASGSNVTFSVAFSDPNGWADIANAEVLINTGLSPQGGCNIGYLPASGAFQLLNDAGTGWSSTVLSNSQCALSGATASVVGNSLTLTFTLSFQATFASSVPQKTVFLQVTDSEGLVAPWVAVGTWTLGAGACTQAPTATLTDVQSVINQALGASLASTDMNADGVINVVDVQLTVEGVLGCGAPGNNTPGDFGAKTMAHYRGPR